MNDLTFLSQIGKFSITKLYTSIQYINCTSSNLWIKCTKTTEFKGCIFYVITDQLIMQVSNYVIRFNIQMPHRINLITKWI